MEARKVEKCYGNLGNARWTLINSSLRNKGGEEFINEWEEEWTDKQIKSQCRERNIWKESHVKQNDQRLAN